MKKYHVELREVIFTNLEVEASTLEQATELVRLAREKAGKKINDETDELTATIYNEDGSESIRII